MKSKLYLFGECSQLNIDAKQKQYCIPFEIEEDEIVTSLSASNNSIFFVMSDGLSFFSNPQSSNLFEQVNKRGLKSVQVGDTFQIWLTRDFQLFLTKTPSFDFVKIVEEKVLMHSVYKHTVACVTYTHRVLFWNDITLNSNPATLDLIESAAEVSCGDRFAVVRCKNSKSAFRIDENGESYPITTFRESMQIKKIAASSNYCLLLDVSGNVFLHGDIGSLKNKTTPILLAQNIHNIFALPRHCLFVDTQGNCYTYGENDKGQLGDGSTIKHARASPLSLDQTPVLVAGGDSFTVVYTKEFDEDLYKLDQSEFSPGLLCTPFEKPEDLIDMTTSPNDNQS